MLIFKPCFVVLLSVKNVKSTEQQVVFLSVRSGTCNFCWYARKKGWEVILTL